MSRNKRTESNMFTDLDLGEGNYTFKYRLGSQTVWIQYIYTYIHTHTQQFADTGQQEVQETILFEKESKARALVYFLEILGNRKWR